MIKPSPIDNKPPLKLSVQLTDEQIRALPSTPVKSVPALDGHVIVVHEDGGISYEPVGDLKDD